MTHGLVKAQRQTPTHPQSSLLRRSGLRPGIYVSNKFPGDAVTAAILLRTNVLLKTAPQGLIVGKLRGQ